MRSPGGRIAEPDLGAHRNLHMADTAHDAPLALVVYRWAVKIRQFSA